jgi:hypothetical protein
VGIAPLTIAQLEPVVTEALVRWEAAGATPAQMNRLAPYTLQITQLPSGVLAMTGPGVIWISPDAAGHGWFIDPTPADDVEFTVGMIGNPSDNAAQNRMDLVSVLAHEMGHIILAMGESAEANDVMTEALPEGVRRMPTPHDLGLAPSAAWSSSHKAVGLRNPVVGNRVQLAGMAGVGVSLRLLDGLFASQLGTRDLLGPPQASQLLAQVSRAVMTLAVIEGPTLAENAQPIALIGLGGPGTLGNKAAATWSDHSLDNALLDDLARAFVD